MPSDNCHLDMLDAQLLHDAGREHARGKRAAENGLKLLVQPANTKLLKIHLFGLEELCV